MQPIPYSATVTTRPTPYRVAEVAGRTWIVDAAGECVCAFSGDDAVRNAHAFLSLLTIGSSIDERVDERTADEREVARDAEACRKEAEAEARDAQNRVYALEDALRSIAESKDESAEVLRTRAAEAIGITPKPRVGIEAART